MAISISYKTRTVSLLRSVAKSREPVVAHQAGMIKSGKEGIDEFGARSSVAERSAHNRLVAGSIPAGPTMYAVLS